MAMVEAALRAFLLVIVLRLLTGLRGVYEFGVDDFAGVDDRLAAFGAGAAVVGDAGMAVGAVHRRSLLRLSDFFLI